MYNRKSFIAVFTGWAVLSILSIASCSQHAREKLLQESGSQENKHYFCIRCHGTDKPSVNSLVFEGNADPSEMCIWCHNYYNNHHPVDIVPAESYFTDCGMSSYPIIDNKIKCLTCHEVHAGPGLEETPKLLRGGPYVDSREPCFKCHFKERYAQIDAHIMKKKDGSLVMIDGKAVCLLCHAVVPDPQVDRTRDVKFKADVAFLCWRCHPPMPQDFFEGHFLIKPTTNTLQYMRKKEVELEVIFPLVPRNRMTCSTCHNPHQEGILLHKPANAGADSPGRLRIPKTEICKACHQMY